MVEMDFVNSTVCLILILGQLRSWQSCQNIKIKLNTTADAPPCPAIDFSVKIKRTCRSNP